MIPDNSTSARAWPLIRIASALMILGAVTAAPASAGEESIGKVSFTVDGETRSFEYLPQSKAFYTKISSSFSAFPEQGSSEGLTTIFMSIDLKAQTYPAQLPLPKDPSKPMNPMAAMASVGFTYTDANGNEWAGPATVQVESLSRDGVLHGTFDGVKLPATDKERPEITLGNGTFHVRITAPW